jgi:tetratricopeptide (TPR) repeat protein
VAVVAALAYAPALENLDALDDHLVAETSDELAGAPIASLFDRTYFKKFNQDTYRPVATLSLMVGHRLGGNRQTAGHVQNGLWHAGNAVLVKTLASQTLGPGPALFAGLLFAVHPAGSEAVLSVGYQEDEIVCFFALLSLLLTLRGGRWRHLCALVAYALALFAKENAAVLPGLLLLTRLTVARDGPIDRRAIVRELAGYVAVTGGYLLVRFGVMASPQPFADPAGGSYAATMVAVPRIFAHYLRLLVVPWPLMVLYANVFPMGDSWIGQLPWLALDVALLVGAVRLARVRPALGFGLLWFALALTPTLHFVPMRVAAADRFLYLSMVGGAIAAGAILEMAIAVARRPAEPRVIWVAASATLLALLVLTEKRVAVWHDDMTLWEDTLRHNSHAYMGHFVVGTTLEARGQYEEARRELEAAVGDCPRESAFGRQRFCAKYAVALGYVRLETHDVPAAREAFRLSLEYAKDNVSAIIGLGYTHLVEGNLAEARRLAYRASQLNATGARDREALDRIRALLIRAEREVTAAGSAPPEANADQRPAASSAPGR